MSGAGRGSCVIIGVGPRRGLGAALCRRFAAEGLHVYAAGRSAERLEAVTAEIDAAGGRATPVLADATSEADVVGLFDRAEADERPLEVAIYNAGNNRPGPIADMDAAFFEKAWRTICFGGFLFGREAVRRWRDARSNGPRSLLFTGASGSLRGRAGFGAFNAAKGGLRNLAQALAKEVAADGVHVGHVIVDGGIAGDKIMEGVPEMAERLGEEGLIELEGLADAFWTLHTQPRRAWTFELDVRTWQEQW